MLVRSLLLRDQLSPAGGRSARMSLLTPASATAAPDDAPPLKSPRDRLLGLLTLAGLGLLLEAGWVLVVLLSYRLGHGPQFSVGLIADQRWLRDLLVVPFAAVNALSPGFEPPANPFVPLRAWVLAIALLSITY